MELITIIQPIVLAIIAGLFSIRILPLFTVKRTKKINDAKLIIELLGDENSLHKGFLMDEIKEASFYQYSKISTNADSIPLYLALKKQLGENVNWKLIKNASPFLVIGKDQISVKISTTRRLLAGVGILSIYFTTIATITYIGYTSLQTPHIVFNALYSIFGLMLIPFAFTIIAVRIFRSEHAAIAIDIKLARIKQPIAAAS